VSADTIVSQSGSLWTLHTKTDRTVTDLRVAAMVVVT
jgi:hypothetical protein